jgi:hypothetical protein
MKKKNMTNEEYLQDALDAQDRELRRVSCNSESAGSVPASELNMVPFPACAKRCLAVEALGCSECESVCGFKFKKDGSPKEPNVTNQCDQAKERT